MTDEVERTDLTAPGARLMVGDVPHTHSVRDESQDVVIRHRSDAANKSVRQHALHSGQHLVRIEPQLFGDGVVRARDKRETILRRRDNAPIDSIDRRLDSFTRGGGTRRHSTNLSPTKNSSCFGMLYTRHPEACSISSITTGMRSGRSVAR